jgi:hypothetical protein
MVALVRLLDALFPGYITLVKCVAFIHTHALQDKRHIPEIGTELARIVDRQIQKTCYGDDVLKVLFLVCIFERQLLLFS